MECVDILASNQGTLDFILDQIASAGEVYSKKMFGEYVVYCNQKVVALFCDDQLFIKPTSSGRKWIKSVIEKPPYPGAKKYFLIPDEQWDDRDWLTELIRITATELPATKKK